jgi:hypothetical protein
MVEVETLESFLEREDPEENAEAIKKVVLHAHLSRQHGHPHHHDVITKDLQILISELRRLDVHESLIAQVRNRIANHWATNLMSTDMQTEEDSYASNFQSKLGKGRKVRGGFADQSSIISDSEQDNSFFSQASQKERPTKSTNHSQMSIEDAEEMKEMLPGIELIGQRSMNSDVLNWQLEPINALSRENSNDDTSDFYDEKHFEEEVSVSRKTRSKKHSNDTSRVTSREPLSQGPTYYDFIPQRQPAKEQPQTFTKHKDQPLEERYSLEGSRVSNDFDISNPKKVSMGTSLESEGKSQPVGKLKSVWNKVSGAFFGGSNTSPVLEFQSHSTKNPTNSKRKK